MRSTASGAYEKGNGVQKDYAQSRSLVSQSSDQGNAVAQLNLGFLYHRATVCHKTTRMRNLDSKAAEQGMNGQNSTLACSTTTVRAFRRTTRNCSLVSQGSCAG